MIKLKKLIKEAYAWERKFGEKLPTLDSVQKKYGKKQLNEKKELDTQYITKVHTLTQRNNHTEARIFLSTMMGNKKLVKFYNAMNDLNDVFGGYGGELSKLNQKMEKVLYQDIKKKFANSAEIIGLL